MKTVNIPVTESFTALTSAEMFAFFSSLICYDGLIDTRHSWYGGLITAQVGENELIFTHDMPNGEWESWYKTALRIFGDKQYLRQEDQQERPSELIE